jgi:hypothetical protein
MDTLALGSIVTYKDDYFVALGYDGHLVTIIAPHKGQRKLGVKRSKITVVNATPLTQVSYKRGGYLVSRKGTIISLTTNVVMDWTEDNNNRLSILEGAQRVVTASGV